MNHEMHEKHEIGRLGMRVRSPLTVETERAMTETIGCAIAVHKTLGPGFLESIYKKAMRIELEAKGVSYQWEMPLTVRYRDVDLEGQRLDLLVEGCVVVELKAVTRLEQIHRAQVISYLHTTGLRAGLLINFRVPILPHGLQRIVL